MLYFQILKGVRYLTKTGAVFVTNNTTTDAGSQSNIAEDSNSSEGVDSTKEEVDDSSETAKESSDKSKEANEEKSKSKKSFIAKAIEYIKETFIKITKSIKPLVKNIINFFKDFFDGNDEEKAESRWFLASKSNNGNDKDNNSGNNGNSSYNGNKGNNDNGNNKDKDKNDNNGNNKNKNKNNGNNGKHKGWYKRADHPKNPGDLDPLDDIGTYEIINYVNDVSLENAQVLMTSDENGNYTNAYTYGLDRISVDNLQVENGVKTDPRYYLYDGRGSVSDVINEFGQAKDKYSYDPYGEFSHGGYLGSSETHYENFYGHNGEDYNRLSGLQYLRARYYEPETGRFLTRDSYLGSIMEPLTLNRYAYGVNNPIMNTDPSGHWPKWLSNAAKKVTSAVSSAWESTKKVVSKAASTVGNALSNVGKEIKSWVAPINETKNNVKTTAENNVYNFKGSLRNTYENIVQQSKPAITTRDYPNEVVRANMVSVKNSCEGAQNVKSQKYEYKDKISQMALPTKIFDMFFPGSFERYENRNNSLYDGVNYWTFGMADTIKGTFNPEKPLSLQHWIDSAMTAFMFLPAMKLADDGVSALLSKSATPKGMGKVIFKSTDDSANVIGKNLNGTVSQLKNGWKVEIPNGRKPIVVRIMNEGSGGRAKPYFRVGIDGKGSLTLDGILSNDRGLTHIDMTDNYLEQITTMINKYLGE